jgi:hypothetical protein
MAIVYIHRKKDIEDSFLNVFYVGIGNFGKRAYQTCNRNKYWHNIVKKHGYYIEITHTDIIWEEACSIEKYLIAFYGRHNKKEGLLCNLTDGGDGTIGIVTTEENRKRKSENVKGSKNPMYGVHLSGEKNPMYGKSGLLAPTSRKIAQYNFNGELIAIYGSLREAGRKTGIDARRISDYCNKKRPFNKRQHEWKYV